MSDRRRVHNRETPDEKKKRTQKIVRLLFREYPSPKTALHHSSPLQLLISTILSAQCTDTRVNLVTPELFRRYTTANEFATAHPPELESIIRSTGFYRAKTKSIIASTKKLVEKYSGEVPRTMEQLVDLPGVGRKTANCVLGNAFGIAAGVVVDTHVKRLSGKLELSFKNDPEKIEADLMKMISRRHWIKFPNVMILHGRKVCIARKPHCESCVLAHLCPSSTA